jgi:hypothetical protein
MDDVSAKEVRMDSSRQAANRFDLSTAARQNAISAAIWGMPIVSVDTMRQAFFRDAGARYNDIVYWSAPADWKLQITTPNASTHYVYFNFNLKNGPVVLEVPRAADAGLFGSILDAWQVPMADVGPQGSDQGNGGKYLLLPPGYPQAKPTGYMTLHFETFNGYGMFRIIPKAQSQHDSQKAVDLIKKIIVYGLSQAGLSRDRRFVDMSGKLFDGIVRFDETFWSSLSRMVTEEPALSRDSSMFTKLRSIGIEKDKSFAPDAALQRVLQIAADEARTFFIERAPNCGTPYWPQLHWRVADSIGPQTGFTFEGSKGLDIDARAQTYFLACARPAKFAEATFYLTTFHDASGHLLQGENTYRLHVPPDVPANQFWALTVYDSETGSFIPESPRVELNSQDQRIRRNTDGSVDVHIGPRSFAPMESNWVHTKTGKRFFAIFRLYGPEQSLFDKSWRLSNIEKANIAQYDGTKVV